MSIKEHRFQIVFSTPDVETFKHFWVDLLKSITDIEDLLTFKINCLENQVTLYLPADSDSFILLASILERVNLFNLNYNGFSRETIRTDYTVPANDSSSPTPIETNVDISEETSADLPTLPFTDVSTTEAVVDTEVPSIFVADREEIPLPTTREKKSTDSRKKHKSITTVAVQEEASAPPSSSQKIIYDSKAIREHILSLNTFNIYQLKTDLPSAQWDQIHSAVAILRANKSIFSTDTLGGYRVNKS
ncbi:MAG: hypothetical protein LBL91_02630 [Lachnospiraceae bacterium]|nr:hypothetical protein [Lachnospiraceae bacterium]